MTECKFCYGKGYVTCAKCMGNGIINRNICKICKGKGIGIQCPKCHGCKECPTFSKKYKSKSRKNYKF